MQNNVPLMKALAKLVTETTPDLVFFVCEALVGNDGMDQLSMFQKALTTGGHTRPIDGIVLTKFDTVSDKVGGEKSIYFHHLLLSSNDRYQANTPFCFAH